MFNAFVKFGSDIKGDCTDADHTDWVQITAFRFNATQPPSVLHKVGHRTAEAVELSEFEVDKLHDSSTPGLFASVCSGATIPEVNIELVKSGGDPLPYTKIKLTDVLVTGVLHAGDPSGQFQFPMETVKMTFSEIEWTFTKQGKDAKGSGNKAAKYNVLTGKAA